MLAAAQKTRVVLVILGFVLVTVALWSRLFWLQVIHPNHWVTIARRQHVQMLELQPTRGAILDRNLKPLAVSIRLTSVFANPKRIKDPAATAQRLAPVLNQPAGLLQEKLSNKAKGFVWLARRIPNQAAAKIRAMRLPAVDVLMEPKRVYPQGYLAGHVLGFAGLDAQGLEGVELVYNHILKGEPGWRWLGRDARRRAVGAWDSPAVAPREGLQVVLTLDSTIQFFAERELDRAYQERRAKGACIVVMDPATGEILAMANRPTFDPNQYSLLSPEAHRNRALTDTFEPGSVFKIVTASVALTKQMVRMDEKFFCENGAYQVAGHILHDHEGHGWLTFPEVIMQSSNIGTVKVAMRLGPNAVYEGVKAFGFGRPTGIELPGEVGGVARPPSRWSKTSITAVPIGQEVTVTAIQLAQAIGSIANGGVMVKPWIIREIQDPEGHVVKSFKPTVVGRVIPAGVDQQMKEILTGVIEQGTGKLAKVPGFSAAGKTGTAQKVEPTGVYSHNRFMASFIGFVPVENPRLVIVVVVDEPHGSYYGGTVSAPVFRNVAADSLAYLRVQPTVVVPPAQAPAVPGAAAQPKAAGPGMVVAAQTQVGAAAGD